MDVPALTPLGPEALRALGIPAPWVYGMADRVRFNELDAVGHVNNTAYLVWFESLRVSYLLDRGATGLGPRDPRIVIRRTAVDYLREMRLGEDYVVAGQAVSMRTNSLTMDYAVFCADGLRATGSAVVVLVGADGGKVPIPPGARAAFAADGAVSAA